MKKDKNMRLGLAIVGLVLVAGGVQAQENARSVRDQSLMMSRYDQVIGKLQDQAERLQSDVRALQRANEGLAKDVQAANARSQNIADEMQRLRNTQLQNLSAGQKQLSDQLNGMIAKGEMPWGAGQRDCTDLGVKHQQIKVSMKPDGTRSVRFLCFDGKGLLLGSEVYGVDGK